MRDRVRDYALLLAVAAALTLPSLGATTLWDQDEGLNAQAAREMAEADTWVVPTFNYQLRTAKPVMLYWLQRLSYAAFGVSEWAARFPSVVAGWIAVLLTYELARRMFGRSVALLSGVALASAGQFVVLSRAATPDAPLLAFTLLAYLAFWAGHANGSRRWWVPTAAACGLAVLTKGPIGVGLPGLVILLYFAWNRELGRLLDHKILWALLVFVLVAGPWYGLVAADTHGEWVKAFIGRENLHRFREAMEGHAGGLWYYPAAVVALFFPWSVFLPAAAWYAVKAARRSADTRSLAVAAHEEASRDREGAGTLTGDARACRFLACWAVAYLVVFSAAATKLPNYVYPMYPALAILAARFLVGWRDGLLAVPRAVIRVGAAGVLVGGAAVGGLFVFADRSLPGLAAWAALGLVPAAAGAGMLWCLRRDDRGGAVTAAAAGAVAFIGLAAVFPPAVVDRHKAPAELVRASGVGDPGRELRLASLGWFQPSVVFYAGRRVERLSRPDAAAEFLATPTPAYLFVPAPVWEKWAAAMPAARVVARHHDFLKRCDILVVTNTPPGDVAAR